MSEAAWLLKFAWIGILRAAEFGAEAGAGAGYLRARYEHF
jgi:hypothetical protein